MGDVPNWSIKIVVGYLIFILFVVSVVSIRDLSFYNLTTEQEELLIGSGGEDALTLLNKFLVLATIEPAYSSLAWLTGILSVAFLLSVATIIRSLLPIP